MLISQANAEVIEAARALRTDIRRARLFVVTAIALQAMGLLGLALIIFA